MSSSSTSNKVALRRSFSISPINGAHCSRTCPRQARPISSALLPSIYVTSPFCSVKSDDQGNVTSTPPHPLSWTLAQQSRLWDDEEVRMAYGTLGMQPCFVNWPQEPDLLAVVEELRTPGIGADEVLWYCSW